MTKSTWIRLLGCAIGAWLLWSGPAVAQMLDGNDEIELIVPNYSELSGRYTLNTQGELSLKICSPIGLNGLSAGQAEKVIADTLQRYLQSVAGLKVTLTQEWNEITVIGYVNTPGKIRIPDQATLAHALVAAGGAIKGALLNRIEIRRRNSEVAPQIVDYERFLYRGDMQLLPSLNAGDIIFVPKGLGEVNSSENLIYIFGAVRSPGIYEISGQTTLLDALAFAGGPASNANLSHVKIIPADPGKKVREVNFKDLEKQNMEVLLLGPGDKLIVPEKGRNYLSLILQLVSAVVLALNAYQFVKG